jgi:hypothetical protein
MATAQVHYSAELPDVPISKDRELIRHHPITGSLVLADSQLSASSNVFAPANVTGSSSKPNTQTVFCIRANPNDFIDTWSSVLSFGVQVRSPALAGTYMHAFHDLIKDIRIESATGEEIERIQDVNMLNSFIEDSLFGKQYTSDVLFSSRVNETQRTDFNKPWWDGPVYPESGTPVYGDSKANFQPYDTVDPVPYTDGERVPATDSKLVNGYKYGASHNVVIPLSFISGFFRMDTLLPPQLAEGMKIFITWADARDVFIYNTDTTQNTFTDRFGLALPLNQNIGKSSLNLTECLLDPSYTLSNIELHLDTHTLDNRIASAVMESYQNDGGLALSYRSYTAFDSGTVINTEAGVDSVALEVGSSFSQATKFLGTVRYRHKTDHWNAFLPLFTAQPRDETFFYQTQHNQKNYPRSPLVGSPSQFWEWQKSFGANKVLFNSNRSSYSDFINSHGNSFVYDMNRSSYNLKHAVSDANFSAMTPTTSQTIDGNNRLSVRVKLPTPPSTYFDTLLPLDLKGADPATNTWSRVWTWVEHFRHINVKPGMVHITL